MEDTWVLASQVETLRQRVIHLRQLPPGTSTNLHPSLYRPFRFRKYRRKWASDNEICIHYQWHVMSSVVINWTYYYHLKHPSSSYVNICQRVQYSLDRPSSFYVPEGALLFWTSPLKLVTSASWLFIILHVNIITTLLHQSVIHQHKPPPSDFAKRRFLRNNVWHISMLLFLFSETILQTFRGKFCLCWIE